jgi:hypothetical protein
MIVCDEKRALDLNRGKNSLQQGSYLRRITNVVVGRHAACLYLCIDDRRFQSTAIKVCVCVCDKVPGEQTSIIETSVDLY